MTTITVKVQIMKDKLIIVKDKLIIIKDKFLFLIKSAANNPKMIAAALRFCFFSGLFLYTELVFQIFTGVIGIGFFRAFAFILLGASMITLITLSLSKLIAFIFSQTVISFLSVYAIAQLIYIKIFNEFFSLGMIGVGGEAIIQFSNILITTIMENIPGILLLLLPVIILPFIFFNRRVKPHIKPIIQLRFSLKYIIIPIAAFFLLRYSLLALVATDFYSPMAIRYGQGEAGRVSSVRNAGLIPTLEIDLLSYVVSTNYSSVLDDVPDLSVIILPSPEAPTPLPMPSHDDTGMDAFIDDPDHLQQQEELIPEPPPWLGKFNSFDIDFEALIERDSHSRGLVQLHEYFSSLRPSAQNEMTGLFEGYNLITISAEAFTKWVIDPELTPTLYKMQNDGINFENFYCVYGAGTIGGEFALCTGYPPRGAGSWCTTASQKYLPFTFASRFHDIGIQPLAYHNGSYTYYDRHILFPGLGYIFKANGGGLNMGGYSWNSSDLFLMEQTVDEYIDMDRFFVHYMTVSGHSPYTFEEPMAARNRDAVAHLPFSSEVKAYIATQLEFEKAMTYLLYRLEEAGIAERTVIVITADHYPYGLTRSKNEELAGKRLDLVSQLFESVGIIYLKGMEPLTVTSPAFVADMVPTVLNLLGLRFDSRFLPGRDVFSDATPFVYLESSIITDYGIYNKNDRSFAPFEGMPEIPEGYIAAVVSIEAARKSSIEQIVRLNYFESIREYIG